MKAERASTSNRVTPYVVPQNTPRPPSSTGEFMDSMVRNSPGPTYLRNFKSALYKAFKAAPLIYLFAPNPVTGAFAVASAVDTLLKVRRGDKVGLFEAGLIALSSLHGAAAQAATTFKYAGNDTLIASSANTTTPINCDSHYAFRSSGNASGQYPYCDVYGGGLTAHQELAHLSGVPALPIPTEQMPEHCQAAYSECYPSVSFNYVGRDKLQANSTRTSSLVDCKSSEAFISQTSVLDDAATIHYSTCDLKTGSVSATNKTDLAVTPVMPIPINDMPSQCEKAFDTCNNGTEPTSTTTTSTSMTPEPTTTPTSAIPEGSSGFSKLALGVSLGGGALLTGGVVSAIAYSQYRKHNQPARSDIYMINPPNDLDLIPEKGVTFENQSNV